MTCLTTSDQKQQVFFSPLFGYFMLFAESRKIFHDKYSKLSFVFQPSILKNINACNTDDSSFPEMEFTNDLSYQFGVYYGNTGQFDHLIPEQIDHPVLWLLTIKNY